MLSALPRLHSSGSRVILGRRYLYERPDPFRDPNASIIEKRASSEKRKASGDFVPFRRSAGVDQDDKRALEALRAVETEGEREREKIAKEEEAILGEEFVFESVDEGEVEDEEFDLSAAAPSSFLHSNSSSLTANFRSTEFSEGVAEDIDVLPFIALPPGSHFSQFSLSYSQSFALNKLRKDRLLLLNKEQKNLRN